jgi:hypothetical protein
MCRVGLLVRVLGFRGLRCGSGRCLVGWIPVWFLLSLEGLRGCNLLVEILQQCAVFMGCTCAQDFARH